MRKNRQQPNFTNGIPEMLISGSDGSLRVHLGTTGAFKEQIGGAPSFGVLGNPQQQSVPNSYKVGLSARGTGDVRIIDLEEVFYPPPLNPPSCRYAEDRYL